MKGSILFAMAVILPAMAAVSAGYFLGAPGLIRLFMDNGQIVDYGSSFLRIMCLGTPFLCMDFMAVGVFQALGLGRNALVFALLRKIVLEIPLLILMNAVYPLYGLPYAQFITEVVLAAAALLMLRRIFRQGEAQE